MSAPVMQTGRQLLTRRQAKLEIADATEEILMRAQSEKLNPHEISTLLRGELESIAAWLEQWHTRRFALHLVVIIFGAGLYGAAMGWWRDPQQALFTAIKFPLIILLTAVGNALHQRHARAVAGIEHPVPPIVLGHSDELHHRGGDSRRVQPGDGVHGLERAADVAAGRLRRNLSIISSRNVAVIAFAGIDRQCAAVSIARAARRQPGRRVARPARVAGGQSVSRQPAFMDSAPIHRLARPAGGIFRDAALHGNFYENVFQTVLQFFNRLNHQRH